MFSREQAIAFHWQRYRDLWPQFIPDPLFPLFHYRFAFGYTGNDGDPTLLAAPGWEWRESQKEGTITLVPVDKKLTDVIKKSDLPG